MTDRWKIGLYAFKHPSAKSYASVLVDLPIKITTLFR